MNTMTRFACIFAATAVIALPTIGQAQTATLTATAVVSTTRSFDLPTNLHFGTFAAGEAAVLVVPETNTASHPDGQRGQIRLTTNAATLVTVSGPTLEHSDGAATGTITPTYTCANAPDSAGSPGVAVTFVCSAGALIVTPLLGLGIRWILVGGAITAPETEKPAGTYTGTITITAADLI